MSDEQRDQPPSDLNADQDSTGEEVRRPRRPRPKHEFPETQAGKLWKAFGNPEDRVNEMPGGMVNSAGGRPKEVSWLDAFRFDSISNAPIFYKQPCARDALLVGIGSGGTVGGLRFILKGLSSMLVTTNYAVGAFAVSSMGMFYWCQQRRREEAQGMAAAMHGMKLLHEKKAREKAAEEAAAREAQEKAEAEKLKHKSWYKFW